MRTCQSIAVLLALTSVPAAAQAQEGPLADPSVAATPVAKAKPAHAKATKKPSKKTAAAKSAAGGSAVPDAAAAPDAAAVPTSGAAHRGTTATDPISFGMKWNGSNDTAERTRVQNYNGDAAGTGASAGFKLHF